VYAGNCQEVLRGRDGDHIQDNHFVSSLYDFQFTELYHDDAIGPKGESILQHALCVKQADEKTTGPKIEISLTVFIFF
jgi:hypothetical protein